MNDESKCPRCGGEMDRDSADIGIGVIYGPWGCPECYYSEYELAGQVIEGRYHDIFGGSRSVELIVEGCERFGLDDDAREAFKSLAPVVGAEGGEQARNESLPVATAEPGPGGTHDGPGRASIEETP